MTHIMLDLETWGKTPGSDIRSIGAVVFDPVSPGGWSVSNHTLMNGETFYVATDNPVCNPGDPIHDDGYSTWDGINDYRKYPLTRDPETVEWWNNQTLQAQAAFANPVDLREGCLQFAIWLESINPKIPVPRYPDAINGEHVRIWANGPQFDVSILAEVYHAVGLPVPWYYRAPRDFRTITDAAGMTREEFSNYGDAHNALHDAIAQAMTVCEAYKRLGLTQ